LAVLYAGATVVPLDIQYSAQQIKQLISHSDSKILIVTEKIYPKLKEDLKDIEMFVVDSKSFQEKLRTRGPENKLDINIDENSLAVLFYTSGTSDLPKGVMLTHANLLSNVRSIEQLHIITRDDRVVSILPLHHAYALTTTLITPLLLGARIIFPPGIASVDLLTCMRETQSTVFVGVPQIYALMHRSIREKLKLISFPKKIVLFCLENIFYAIRRKFKFNLSKALFKDMHKAFGPTLRFMVSGGARLDPDIAKNFLKWGFTILEGYGLTETSPVVSFNPPDRIKIGSVGKSMPNVEIKIIEPNENGVGEVAVKGPNVMAGYYHMERETEEAIKDRWFFTGDLGYLDKDRYLFLTGRKKELIILSNGKNIHPDEIEKYYGQNPFIKEIGVLAVKDTTSFSGVEHLAAIIVMDEDYFKQRSEMNIRDRLKWELDNLSAKLPSYKRIKGFMISQDPLPRTRLGKLMRYQLPKIYDRVSNESRLPKEGQNPKEIVGQFSELSKSALAFLQENFKREINIKDHLELDLGLDSLGRVELLLSLQERLNLNMSDEEAMDFFMCNTVEDLLSKLRAFAPHDTRLINEEHTIAWENVLKEDPQVDTLSKVNINPSLLYGVVNIIIISFIKIFFRVFFLLRVEGRQNLKREGPYVICPNHTSYLDGLFVLSALPMRIALKTYFVGLSEFFEHPFLRGITKTARLIPMEASFNLVEALKACSYVLRHEKIVCYFPEGQRSIDGEVKEFKKGIGILIKESNVPVVPVYLEGAFRTWPRGQRLPRLAPIKVRFGRLLPVESLEMGVINEKEIYDVVAKNLREQVINLKKKFSEKGKVEGVSKT